MIWLLVWTAVTRLPYLFSSTLLFGFDQGRDALAALHLVKTLNPVFIGPWTSIPGLYFGPGWYYLLAPGYWLTQGSPMTGAMIMFGLSLLAIYFAYKYFGGYEAAIMATGPIWLQLATGAGNAYPMALIGLLIVILIKLGRQPFWLGFTLGLGFHFSSALAIFWLLVTPWLIKLKQWPKFIVGLLLTFIPQLLFELKHGFSQTKAVIAYFTAGESQKISLGKISTVNQSVVNELSLAVLPDILWLKLISEVILLTGLFFVIKQKRFVFWPKLAILTIIPTVGFWFLHYNPWYSYGLLPLAVVAAGKILRSLPKPLAWLFIGLLLINSAAKLKQFLVKDRQVLGQHKGFFAAKMAALDYIYSQADGRPFTSYHYHPEIYDYAYQYLFIWQGFKGKPLPVEFSYQPKVPAYVPEKNGLLAKLPRPTAMADVIFLIVEKPDNIWHYPFDFWLSQINYSEIIDKKIIGPELEVWQALPRHN